MAFQADWKLSACAWRVSSMRSMKKPAKAKVSMMLAVAA